jgi:hypothetical protein
LRIFKVKAFAKWVRRERITDSTLREAVAEMQHGLIDANLGGGVYKKRVSASSRGKRGGARTIVAFQSKQHTFFMFGFLKNETPNIEKGELRAFKLYAASLFRWTKLISPAF